MYNAKMWGDADHSTNSLGWWGSELVNSVLYMFTKYEQNSAEVVECLLLGISTGVWDVKMERAKEESGTFKYAIHWLVCNYDYNLNT